jgi:hypothetical protein
MAMTKNSTFSSFLRVEVHVPGQQDVIELPPAPHVDDRAQATQTVTEQAGQQGRTHQRVVLALVEHVHGDRQRVTAAGQRGADDDVVDHPDAPGITTVEIGHRAHAFDKAHHQEVDTDRADDAEQHERPGHDTLL